MTIIFDPVEALSKAIAVNNFIKAALINNNGYGNNPAGITRIETITNDPNYQQPIPGGIWFFDGIGSQMGYNYYPTQNENHNYTLDWFDSLGLGLGIYHIEDGIPYLELFSQ